MRRLCPAAWGVLEPPRAPAELPGSAARVWPGPGQRLESRPRRRRRPRLAEPWQGPRAAGPPSHLAKTSPPGRHSRPAGRPGAKGAARRAGGRAGWRPHSSTLDSGRASCAFRRVGACAAAAAATAAGGLRGIKIAALAPSLPRRGPAGGGLRGPGRGPKPGVPPPPPPPRAPYLGWPPRRRPRSPSGCSAWRPPAAGRLLPSLLGRLAAVETRWARLLRRRLFRGSASPRASLQCRAAAAAARSAPRLHRVFRRHLSVGAAGRAGGRAEEGRARSAHPGAGTSEGSAALSRRRRN